jgi:hypothetical protein
LHLGYYCKDSTGALQAMSELDPIPLKPSMTTDVHTVTSRERLRSELAADVEAFLRRGGCIEAITQPVAGVFAPPTTVGYERELF